MPLKKNAQLLKRFLSVEGDIVKLYLSKDFEGRDMLQTQIIIDIYSIRNYFYDENMYRSALSRFPDGTVEHVKDDLLHRKYGVESWAEATEEERAVVMRKARAAAEDITKRDKFEVIKGLMQAD